MKTRFGDKLHDAITADNHDDRTRAIEGFGDLMSEEMSTLAGRLQGVVWDTEGRLLAKLDHLFEQIDNNNTLVSSLVTSEKTFQDELKRGVGNVIMALHTLRDAFSDLDARDRRQFEESSTDRAEIRDLLTTYIAQLPLDQRAKLIANAEQIPSLAQRLDDLERRMAALEAFRGDG